MRRASVTLVVTASQPLRFRRICLLALRRFSPALQPSLETLFSLEHGSGLPTQPGDETKAGLGKPGHAVRNTAVFLFVGPFPAPIVDLSPAALPVPHGIPV